MEKQQFVAQTIYKKLNGEVEDVINTNQFNFSFDIVQEKKIIIKYRETTVDIDGDTYRTATSDAPFLWLGYDENDEKWFDGDENEIDLATYGITINGTPQGQDTLIIRNNDGVITYNYLESTNIYPDDSNNFWNYVCVTCSLPTEIEIGNVIHIVTEKVEIDLNAYGFQGAVNSWNRAKKDVEVNLILAKRKE